MSERRQLRGASCKYRGKDRERTRTVRLTDFAERWVKRGMKKRRLSSFYDYVEELMREDAAANGVNESEHERRRRETAPA